MRCILDTVLQSELQQVLSRDVVKLPVDRHLVRGRPAAIRIIGQMETIVEMGHTAKRLHVYLLTILAVKTLGQEMCPSVLLYQSAFRHLYATSLGQLIEGVL